MKKCIIWGAAVLFLFLSCVHNPYDPATWENTLPIGGEAPGFSLEDMDGTVHQLSDYRGKFVILDFWASWCSPCVSSMPTMQYLHETFSARGLAVIGLNFNETGSPAAFISEHHYTYTILLNAEAIGTAYGIIGLPSFLILDPAGIILEKELGWNGDVSAAGLKKSVQDYLAEYINNG